MSTNNAGRPDPPDANELLANAQDRFRVKKGSDQQQTPKRPGNSHASNLVMRPPVRSNSGEARRQAKNDTGSGRLSRNNPMALGNFFQAEASTAKLANKNKEDWDLDSRGAYSTVSKMHKAKIRKSAKTSNSNEPSLETTIKESFNMDKLDGLLGRRSSHPRLESGDQSTSTTSKTKSSSHHPSSSTPKPSSSGHPSTPLSSRIGSSRHIQSTPQSGSSRSSSSRSPPNLTPPSSAPTKPTRRISGDRDHQPSTPSATTNQSRTTAKTLPRGDGSRRKSLKPDQNQIVAVTEETPSGSVSGKMKKGSRELSKRRVSATSSARTNHRRGRSSSHGNVDDDVPGLEPCSDPPLPIDEKDFVELQKVAAVVKLSIGGNAGRRRSDTIGFCTGATMASISTTSRPGSDNCGEIVDSKSSNGSSDAKESKSGCRRSIEGNGVAVLKTSHLRSSVASGEIRCPRSSRRSSNGDGGFNKISSGTRRISQTGSISSSESRLPPAVPLHDIAESDVGEAESTIKTGMDLLKTSHLRRLIEPNRRLARTSSHSSGFSGSRASVTSSAVSSLEDEKTIRSVRGPRFPSRMDSDRGATWRPPSSRRVFAEVDNDKRGDSAPKTPRRRSSVATSRPSIGSSSSRLPKPSRHMSTEFIDPEDYEDVSVSERIQEVEDEDSSSLDSDDDMVLLELDIDGEEDIFTCYSWSTARQDPEKVQKERKRLRDSIRDTPLYRAYESTCFLYRNAIKIMLPHFPRCLLSAGYEV
jgi:hypothetical protein